jgi:hypothetical protein
MNLLGLHRLLSLRQHPHDRPDDPARARMLSRNGFACSARLRRSPTGWPWRLLKQGLQGSNGVGEQPDKGHVTEVNANRGDTEGRFDVIARVYADSVDHGLEDGLDPRRRAVL